MVIRSTSTRAKPRLHANLALSWIPYYPTLRHSISKEVIITKDIIHMSPKKKKPRIRQSYLHYHIHGNIVLSHQSNIPPENSNIGSQLNNRFCVREGAVLTLKAFLHFFRGYIHARGPWCCSLSSSPWPYLVTENRKSLAPTESSSTCLQVGWDWLQLILKFCFLPALVLYGRGQAQDWAASIDQVLATKKTKRPL